MTAFPKDKQDNVPSRFTVRVYGVLIQSGKVLLSKENIQGFAFTKFPGGGLEFGEGPTECVVREFKEETGASVQVQKHLYTSDFFIQSHFAPEEQVIGIYYLVSADEKLHISEEPASHPFRNTTNRISHLWITLEALTEDMLTFDMDKAALRVLKSAEF